MKINDIFSEDQYAIALKCCARHGYIITEVDPDENGRRFQLVKPPQPSEIELAQIEIDDLRNWFDVFYTREEQKLRRLRTLSEPCDDGSDPYEALITLYNVAEEKRRRIQYLEEVLNGYKRC